MAAPQWVGVYNALPWMRMRMTVADDVAVSVQRGLVLHNSTSMIHVAKAISRSECALVHELMQPAIHHIDGKWRRGDGGRGECGTVVGVACVPLIPSIHLFIGWPDQVHQAAPLQECYLTAPLGWTGVLKIFFPALTQVREDLFNPVDCVAIGARGPTNNVDPATGHAGDCVDKSATGREESCSNYRMDEIPGPRVWLDDRRVTVAFDRMLLDITTMVTSVSFILLLGTQARLLPRLVAGWGAP